MCSTRCRDTIQPRWIFVSVTTAPYIPDLKAEPYTDPKMIAIWTLTAIILLMVLIITIFCCYKKKMARAAAANNNINSQA